MDQACATEAHTLCTLDANVLTLLQRAAVVDEDKIRQRRQRVRDCLIDHADELSPACVQALVGDVVATQSVMVPSDEEDGRDMNTEATATEEHHQHAPLPSQSPVVALVPTPQQTITSTNTGNDDAGIEVRIFLINHPGQAVTATATPAYIRIGGDSAQYTGGGGSASSSSSSASGMAMPAWLWVTMLPFLCIGMYVSATQTLAYLRRRRDVVYRVGAAQYTPIPSSLSSSSGKI